MKDGIMKKKVALCANGWNAESLDSFISGFREYFKTIGEEVDLFIFTSYSLYTYEQSIRDAEDSIYSLTDYSDFDAVIIFGSGINSDDAIKEIIAKCRKANVPVILQGCESDEVSTVVVDNYRGMKELCRHLIEKHNVKDVVFFAGHKDNADSNLRAEAVRESLHEYGYKFQDEDIYYLNWAPGLVYTQIQEIFVNKKRKAPDAIMCANDQTAIFAATFLDMAGINVPGEVIVSGFDCVNAGKIIYPSLASVDQDYEGQGRECAELADKSSKNKRLFRKRLIPCITSPGESCGCINCKNEGELRKKLGNNKWFNQFMSESIDNRESEMDSCIMMNEEYKDIHESMSRDFLVNTGVETADFHVYVNPQYKDLVYMDDQNPTACYSPVMDVIAAKTGGVIYDDSTLDSKKLFLGYDGQGKGKIYVLKSLKVGSSVAGYMVMGYANGEFERRRYLSFSGRLDRTFNKYQRKIVELNNKLEFQKNSMAFLHQTVEALASAVDAKDRYTHGHSARVAEYAKKIAELSGIEEKECEDIYMAGLLHDVGKIGIKDEIINKKGKLTDEEFAVIKQHPVLGEEILSKIIVSPYLSVGAKHHHERYDGKGYPDRLKGEDIPQIARIIAVADAYDAMTSKRSYRDVIPQMYVREELVKGMGTQFDPEFAKCMLHLLDMDGEYKMREKLQEDVFGKGQTYEFGGYKADVTAGIRITDCPVSVKIQYEPQKTGGMPTLLLYDSADAHYYLEDNYLSEDMDFTEFASIGMDGDVSTEFIRKMRLNSTDLKAEKTPDKLCNATVFLVKQKDHMLVKLVTDERMHEVVFAMYDAARYTYLALTGNHCRVKILDVEVAKTPVAEDFVPCIAEKISYINRPMGDIPNVQVDGWKADHSEVIEFTDSLNASFHTMSLPSSRRVWHCPIVCLFTSDDGRIDGPNYKELAMVRLDGEAWSDVPEIINRTQVSKNENFENWSIWKQRNKSGVYCRLSVKHKNDLINLEVEDSGLTTLNQTKLTENVKKLYCYFTGDQCAITDIRIEKA